MRELPTVVKRMTLARDFSRGELGKFEEIQKLGYNGIVYQVSDEEICKLYEKVYGGEVAKESVGSCTAESSSAHASLPKHVLAEELQGILSRKWESEVYPSIQAIGKGYSRKVKHVGRSFLPVEASTINFAETVTVTDIENTAAFLDNCAEKIIAEVLAEAEIDIHREISMNDMEAIALLPLLVSYSDQGIYEAERLFGNTADGQSCMRLTKTGEGFVRQPALNSVALAKLNAHGGYVDTPDGRRQWTNDASMEITGLNKLSLGLEYAPIKGDPLHVLYVSIPVLESGVSSSDALGLMHDKNRWEAENVEEVMQEFKKYCLAKKPVYGKRILLPVTVSEGIRICELLGDDTLCLIRGIGTYGELRKALVAVQEHKDNLWEVTHSLMESGAVMLRG